MIAWLVLVAGASSGTLPRENRRWSLPVLVRLGEYTDAGVDRRARRARAPIPPPSRCCRRSPSATTTSSTGCATAPRCRRAGSNLLAAGWEGRLIIAYVLLVAGALPAGFFVWAGVLGAVSLAETVVGWRRFEQARRPSLYEDKEDVVE